MNFIQTCFEFLKAHFTELVAIAGSVVMTARLVVKLTPTPKDDSILDSIVSFLKHLGLHIDG